MKIVSELAEQIGLDHVARFSRVGNGSESVASKYLSAQLGAIATLTHGLRVARDYCLVIFIKYFDIFTRKKSGRA